MRPNISKKHRCIFVHIPKNAGTSMEYRLGFYKLDGTRGQQDHRTISEMKKSVSKSVYNKYVKFTFVRNPWARAYSWYQNVMSDPIHKKEHSIPTDDYSFTDFVKYNLHTWALKTQMEWITDENGNIPLDFIGKFENITEDFPQLCMIIGLESTELPYLIPGTDTDYQDHYTEETKEIIAQKYAEEIALFNYTFENG